MNLPRLILIVALLAACAILPGRLVVGGECGITEGPDTVGSTRAAAESLGCAPDEDGNRDADVVNDPVNGWPLVVCARSSGADRDIAFDEWTRNGWLSRPVYLTSSTLDEVDPRLHIDAAGNVHVVWWEDAEPPSVLMVRRPAGSPVWDSPELVAATGKRPVVATWNGSVVVAFERDAQSGGLELVVATRGADGFAFDVLALHDAGDPFAAKFSVSAGRLWIEWRGSEGHRVASEPTASGWTSPRPLGWVTVYPEPD